MDDTRLTPDEEQDLRDAIASAPQGLKDDFCKCWPVVKRMLEWLHGRIPSEKLKAAIALAIKVGDLICGGEQSRT